jgi:hypothetical protein
MTIATTAPNPRQRETAADRGKLLPLANYQKGPTVTILPDWPTRAKIQARLHSDAFVQAIDEGDYATALDACRRMRGTCDWVARELIPLVVNGDAADRQAELRQRLYFVRQAWQHTAGAPRDRADFERAQASIVAQLQVTA